VNVIKYAPDGTTILDETTVTYQWMEDNLPVQGDGATHYYYQGPVFEDEWENTYSLTYTGGDWPNSEEKWDRVNWSSGYVQEEQCNCYPNKDLGACKGTDVRDLCNLVGGMSPGDEVKIKAFDGFFKKFPYSVIYNDEPALGPYVVTWYSMDAGGVTSGYTGENYTNGMRAMFFSDTSVNPWGEHITGIGDMTNHIPEEYWHYYVNYPIFYPALGGYTVKYVSKIEIYASEWPECLGNCYEGSTCDGTPIDEMNCSECLKEAGRMWKPNKDEVCFNGVEPSDLCLDWCPECCDGINNDEDDDTDYPADQECTCGLDPSETTSGPPIPELTTLAFMSIGILGLLLLVRKRG
jgi:hypothetical protein